jgi:hypothetical protein
MKAVLMYTNISGQTNMGIMWESFSMLKQGSEEEEREKEMTTDVRKWLKAKIKRSNL